VKDTVTVSNSTISILKQFESNGMIASGTNPDSGLVEIMEIPSHPFFIGVQYHPELKSSVEKPAPLFVSFIAAVKKIQ
jgi:CTP synthase